MPTNMHNDVFTGRQQNRNYGTERSGFEEGFVNFYLSQNRAAGTYVKRGPIWTRE